ncbi:T9SS type A sorting domain-containing protein [Flavobacterium sp. NG2]|uniref:T9SS type A sorting domain-containing protein n=1 Tax=Flavobacterium sp. NG2 TaxID=3097547 RepID=UPI002A7F7703|nr:T9SS type A sorting domain-containing protein [Flavobacterium sp. NG2]WPR71403.1 T9SS type A sorting domain-containing protein [Flavobacterium sp. NG2]
MKKFYLSILFAIAFMAITNAQTFNFTNSNDNFTPTGSSAVTLNPTTITYTITGGRTNFYIDQATVANGGWALNSANYNYVKVVMKNNSNLGFLTIRNGGTNLGNTAVTLSKNDTEFKTYYYQLNAAAYTGTIDGFRVFFGTGTTASTDNIEIDKVEFINFIATPTSNGFVKNPGFEDQLGNSTPWKTSSNAYVKTLLDYANGRTGQASMKFEYLSNDTPANMFIFSDDTIGVEPGAPGATYGVGSVIEVKCWIKTTVGTPAFNMLMRFPLRDGVSTTPLKNVDGIGAVPAGDGNWHQITFSYTTTASDPDFKTIGIWPGILSSEGLGGLNTTHAVWLDDFTSTFTGITLGTKKNTLEGVSIYPNPTTDVLNVNAPEGSSIEIFNTLGAVVKTAKGTTSVSVSDLASGLYLVKVSKDGKTYQDKIVKK